MSFRPLAAIPDSLRGILWMLVTVSCFASMAIAGRELSASLSTPMVLFYRSAVGFIIMAVVVSTVGGGLRAVRTVRPGFHVLRNVVHFLGQFGWFYGVANLPLAKLTALASSLPVMGALLAVLFLGERIRRNRVILLGLGFVGVLMILRPGWIPVETAALIVLGGTLCYAGSTVMVKQLTRTDSAMVVVFYMMLMQMPMALLPALDDFRVPLLADMPFVLIVGATGLLAHYAMARALTLADASLVLPFNYLQLPLMAVVGFVLYAESPDSWTLAGGAVILGASWWTMHRETRRPSAA